MPLARETDAARVEALVVHTLKTAVLSEHTNTQTNDDNATNNDGGHPEQDLPWARPNH